MRRSATFRHSCLMQAVLASLLTILAQSATSHETEQTTSDPGFRPDSEHTVAFLDALDTATIAVYPTIIRRSTRTAHSFESRDQIVTFLNEHDVVAAVAASNRIDLGKLWAMSQWDLFQSDMERIANAVKGWRSDAQYHLFLEVLFPVDDQNIFGIQCYVLGKNGENAFSFLLNSHHRSFAKAELFARNSSREARTKLLRKATHLGVSAFEAQIKRAKEQAELAPQVSTVRHFSVVPNFLNHR